MNDPYRDNPFTTMLREKGRVIRGLRQRRERDRKQIKQLKARVKQLDGLYQAEVVESSNLCAMVNRRDSVIQLGTFKVASIIAVTMGFGHAVQYASTIPQDMHTVEMTHGDGGSSGSHDSFGAYSASSSFEPDLIEIDLDDDSAQACVQPFLPPPVPRDPFQERAIGRSRGENVYIPWPTALAARPMPTANIPSFMPAPFVAYAPPALPF